jgi:two-component system LytT family response regulator
MVPVSPKDGEPNPRIRLILVDDEPLARSGVRARLRDHDDFAVVAEASSAQEAINGIRRFKPDAIFLDVEMIRSSGLDVARLVDESVRPIIVFLTAHRQYALQAFEVKAADYLLKPINDARFEMSLNRIREQYALRRAIEVGSEKMSETVAYRPPAPTVAFGRIAITDRKKTQFVEAMDVEWVSAAGDYTELHVQRTTHLLREPLSVLLGRLPSNVFCRIHRSFVVNLAKVSGYMTLRNQDLMVRLKDGTVLRASRTFSDDLKKALAQN